MKAGKIPGPWAARLRRIAALIPDERTLEEMLADIPDSKMRQAIVERLRPYLAFEPRRAELETVAS